jgi:apolipoprotein N-acyltransferase
VPLLGEENLRWPQELISGRLGGGVAAMLVLAGGFGFARLDRPAGNVQRIALIALRQDGDRIDVTAPEGRTLLDGYLREVRRVISAGARIVVLPETVFGADSVSLGEITGPLAAIARSTGATIIVGVGIVDPAGSYNTAQIMSGTDPVTTYRKRYLLAVEPYSPGSDGVFVPGTAWAVAICKDLDFPGLARDYRRAGAQVLLVPAWDFGQDGWLHSRMAVVRGVENGLPVARSTRYGVLAISDPYGRVMAEAPTGTAPSVSIAADVVIGTVSTPYTRFGPWFAWLCLVLAALTAMRLVRPAEVSGRGQRP